MNPEELLKIQLFVSVGTGISLNTATEIIQGLVTKESHIPLPTRLADLETHIARKALHST